MAQDFPGPAKAIVGLIETRHGTIIELREALTDGKSGAFVALVDCSGQHDGVYVLKVDLLPGDWEDEESRHRKALEQGAFSGRLPEIVLSERSDDHYGILLRLAGHSRITWRPLTASLKLFRSAYIRFGEISFSRHLFSFGALMPCAQILGDFLGYQLSPLEGRIQPNIEHFLGHEFTTARSFVCQDALLPNPLYFAQTASDLLKIRPLLGPVHGDCHAQNLFVRAHEDASVSDVYLIDLAFYRPSALLFFDHAYLELATLLRHLEQLGQGRWLRLVSALASYEEQNNLVPQEKGWYEDIVEARRAVLANYLNAFPDRGDDLRLQFLLAQVAAGMSFLNKRPRIKDTSGGLSSAQFEQAFIWSAVFLDKIFELARLGGTELSRREAGPTIPVLGIKPSERPFLGIAEEDWQKLRRFDPDGFNILVLPPHVGIEGLPYELRKVVWSLVVDFGVQAPDEHQLENMPRTFRQSWPGEVEPDPKLLLRGALNMVS